MHFGVGHPQHERVEFEQIEYQNECCDDVDDVYGANWLECAVSVEAGGLGGRARVLVLAQEVHEFLAQCRALYEKLEGHAEFKTVEDQVYLLIEGDGLGHMVCNGHLADQPEADNRLTFVLRFDQTLLWHTVSELEEVIAARPVRKV